MTESERCPAGTSPLPTPNITGAATGYIGAENRIGRDSGGGDGRAVLFFGDIGHNPQTENFKNVDDGENIKQISGTLVRMTLTAGKRLSRWVMREKTRDVLLAKISAGRALFHP